MVYANHKNPLNPIVQFWSHHTAHCASSKGRDRGRLVWPLTGYCAHGPCYAWWNRHGWHHNYGPTYALASWRDLENTTIPCKGFFSCREGCLGCKLVFANWECWVVILIIDKTWKVSPYNCKHVLIITTNHLMCEVATHLIHQYLHFTGPEKLKISSVFRIYYFICLSSCLYM